ncbi:MAG: hypothetical protein Q8P60_10065 [Pseudorhodobacter sp.]|nr:hypothetical protein [Pseudorhodobacter sp.]
MTRRLFILMVLSLLLGSGLISLTLPANGLIDAALADENNNQSDHEDDHEDDHDDDNGDDHEDSGSDNEGSSGNNSNNNQSPGGSGEIWKLYGDDGIRLIYSNGSSERIVRGRYERTDRSGRVIEQHSATRADRSRLAKLNTNIKSTAAKLGVQSIITISSAKEMVQIVDSAGWNETLRNARYILTDPNGNVVTKRAATAKDIARFSETLGLH